MSDTSLKFHIKTTDGKEYTVTAVFADLIRYDVLRARMGWPPREGNEFLFMGLVSFNALLRTGQIPPGSTPEPFLDTIESIEPTEEPEAEFPVKSDN